MKKFLCVAMFALGFSANAQFRATPNGVVANDGDSVFVIVVGKDAKSLYADIDKTVRRKYGSAVITEEKNGEYIEFRTNNNAVFKLCNTVKNSVYANIVLDVAVRVKDGRMEIYPPLVNENAHVVSDLVYPDVATPKVAKGEARFCYMYKPDGSPRHKKGIERFEEWLNTFINDFVEAVRRL